MLIDHTKVPTLFQQQRWLLPARLPRRVIRQDREKTIRTMSLATSGESEQQPDPSLGYCGAFTPSRTNSRVS